MKLYKVTSISVINPNRCNDAMLNPFSKYLPFNGNHHYKATGATEK